MAGYTRQSTSEIATGEVVLAAPLNAEFNAIEAAFHATTGHTHSGSAADGPKISVATSVSGILKAANGGTGVAFTSTVDNTVPRFNGTLGVMQTSAVVIDDNGNLKAGSGSVLTATGAIQLQAVGASTVGVLIENTETTGAGFITFGDGAIAGRITYSHTTDVMTFTANATTVLTLSSTGDATFAGGLTISDDAAVGGTLGVTGAFFGNTLTVASVESGTVSATGATNGKLMGDLVLDSSRTLSTAASHIRFFNPNGLIGSISTNGSTTSYNVSSDGRLKENLRSFDSGSFIDALAVYKFDWKSGGSGYGVIAQEAREIFPDAVVLPEFEEDMLGVDYSKFIPLLLEEVKQLRKRVAELEK